MKKRTTTIVSRATSFFITGSLFLAMYLAGCSDAGTEPTSSSQPPPAQPSGQTVSFQSHIQPIFQRYGCNACHGGSGGLNVQTVSQLLQGGLHGPAIISGKADSSFLVKKLLPAPPVGDRMPQGGPFLPDSSIQTIRLWINQGAKNN